MNVIGLVVYNLIKFPLTDRQNGFLRWSYCSTTTDLVAFTNYVIHRMDCDVQVDATYSDFSKVFDKVNHEIFLTK